MAMVLENDPDMLDFDETEEATKPEEEMPAVDGSVKGRDKGGKPCKGDNMTKDMVGERETGMRWCRGGAQNKPIELFAQNQTLGSECKKHLDNIRKQAVKQGQDTLDWFNEQKQPREARHHVEELQGSLQHLGCHRQRRETALDRRAVQGNRRVELRGRRD